MRTFLLLFATTLFLAGCGSSASQKVYLTLEPAAAQPLVKSEILPFKILIKEMEPRRLYDNPSVVIRKTDFSIGYARKTEWAIRPAMALTEMVENALLSKVPCQAIRRRYSESLPSLLVQGVLLKAEEDLRQEQRNVTFAARFQISRLSDESLLFEKEYSSSKPLAENGLYSDFAATLNGLMQDAANRFALDALEALKAEADAKNHSAH